MAHESLCIRGQKREGEGIFQDGSFIDLFSFYLSPQIMKTWVDSENLDVKTLDEFY